jgi:hypothetical protein
MFLQVRKFKIRHALLVLILLSGLVVFLETPALAVQSVTFGWEPSMDPNVAGYNIYYSTASHAYDHQISVGNVSTATISGLVEGTTYYFAATTYDVLNQESVLSDEISYTVPAADTNQLPTITATNVSLNPVLVNQSLTISATVTPGAGAVDPNSGVTVNLTALGGLAAQPLVYDGAGSYTNSIAVGEGAVSGNQTLSVTVNDSLNNSAAANISLMVYSSTAATLNPASSGSGQFALNVSGVPQYQYVVQASTNLVDWTSVQTNVAPFTFVDSNASQFSQRFYRTFCITF